MQLVDVIDQLPKYKQNIHDKAQALTAHKGGGLGKVARNMEDLSKELKTTPADQPVRSMPREPARTARSAPPPERTREPMPVQSG